jgi:hypothetical protein
MPMRTEPTRPNRGELPTVWLVGEVEHPEFVEPVSLVGPTAQVTSVADARQAATQLASAASAPELIVLAASRPGVIQSHDVERLRRVAPLAGFVALLGSWCEGETRSGRPWPGIARLYWYEFASWWYRQLAARADGRCPEWARPTNSEERGARSEERATRSSLLDCHTYRLPQQGLIVLDTTCWETADSLAGVLRTAGFATAWTNFGHRSAAIRGMTAGIWEGRQLDEHEALRLATFCCRLAEDGAPVVAMLDFPRRDRIERARQAGAAAVLGKPWLNADLLATIELVIDQGKRTMAAQVARAA